MGWTPVIEVKRNDFVETPQGKGRVIRVSEVQKTAHVDVSGQLYEVPLEQVKSSQPEQSGDIQVGDRVELLERSGGVAQVGEVGTVKNVRHLGGSLTVDFPSQSNYSTSKNQVKKVSAEGQPQPEGEAPVPEARPIKPWTAKPGKRVQTKDGAMKGEIKEVTQRSVKVDFDNGVKQSFEKRRISTALDEEQTQPEQKQAEQKQEAKPEQTQPHESNTQAKDTVSQTGDGLHELLKLKEYLESKIDGEVDEELKELRELIKQKQQLEVKVGDKVNTVPGLKHKQLEQLIKYCALRLSPLMVGMAGTGKTHAGEQTASALGLNFYAMSVGAQTSKSDIIGYMAANGQYVTTHFRKAYEEGGVFLMDEIDAGNANVLIQINAALSNGLCAFPDAMVKRHEDFVFIASANTFGNGANRQYVGRNQLDAATLDRFAVIEWFIDDDLEAQLTTGINGKAWYMAVRAARDYVAEKKIRALVSPRATQKGSKLLHVGQDLSEVIDATLLGSVPEDKKQDVRDVATKVFEKFASEVPSKLSKQVNPQVSDLISNAPF